MLTKRKFFKYVSIGFLVQVIWLVASGFFGQSIRDFNSTVFEWWAVLGEYAAPSGPGGHAMPVGAMLGLLVGVIVHSFLFGTVLYVLRSVNKD